MLNEVRQRERSNKGEVFVGMQRTGIRGSRENGWGKGAGTGGERRRDEKE